MKKRIFIWMTAMHLGGVERSLIGLLETIDYSKYDVDLFLNHHEGELLSAIPEQVNLLPEETHYKSLAEPLVNTIKRGHLLIAASRLFGKIMTNIRFKKGDRSGASDDYSHRYTKWLMPKINSDVCYDLALSYITPHYFVDEKINAKEKAAWIHSDYTKFSIDYKSQYDMWSRYSRIVAVSENVKNTFTSVFPSLSERITVFENILPAETICADADAFSVEDEMPDNGEIKLLSIGRYCEAKNFENVPRICRLIREKGLNIHWYIIGYGGYEELIKSNIKSENMGDFVTLLGKKSNPYPYMKNCDYYVQPSRYEGKAISVIEAQILGKFVIITAFPTSASQLKNGIDGIIVPMKEEECADAMAEILVDKDKKAEIEHYCLTHDYSSKDKIHDLYNFI